MIHDHPNPRKKINWNNHLSTIIGAVVAIANAWVNVDWSNFEMNIQHLGPLVVSGLIGLGGWMTSINSRKV